MKRVRFILAGLLALVSVGLAAQENREEEPVHLYGFKSAVIKVSTDMMGQTVVSTTYIDDYGAKECQKLKMEIPGAGLVETSSITKEGKVWSINHTSKQVQEVELDPGVRPDFYNLTDEMKEKFKIQELGSGKVIDLDCQIYSYETESQGMTVKIKVWCYKGCPIKTESEVMGMKITATATEFKENAVVLPQVFEVPEF